MKTYNIIITLIHWEYKSWMRTWLLWIPHWPHLVCRVAPPNSSAEISSPRAAFTRGGPPRNRVPQGNKRCNWKPYDETLVIIIRIEFGNLKISNGMAISYAFEINKILTNFIDHSCFFTHTRPISTWNTSTGWIEVIDSLKNPLTFSLVYWRTN